MSVPLLPHVLAHGSGFASHIDWWIVGMLATGIAATAYLALGYVILKGVWTSGQMRTNPLALATGLIFVSCGIGHGAHAWHAILPFIGMEVELGMATREIQRDWHMWVFDGFTAAVAIWYWTLRTRFPALLRGTAMFEDMRVRQRQALEIHDNVVQGLATAKLNLELGDEETGMKEIEATLAASRSIITDLLGEAGNEQALKPGEYRRGVAAGQGE